MMLKNTTQSLPSQLNEWVDTEECRSLIEEMLQLGKQQSCVSGIEVGLSKTIGMTSHARLGDVESLEYQRDNSIGLTVYVGQQSGNASTTDLSLPSLKATFEAALNIARMTQEDPCSGLPDPSELAKNIVDCDLYHPWALSADKAIEMAIEMEAAGREHPEITNSEGASVNSSQSFHAYANSDGFYAGYPTSRHSLSCALIAELNGKMERDYAYRINRDASNLPPVSMIGEMARDKTLQRRGAEVLKSRQCPVIFHHEIASSFFSPFFSAISGSALYRGQSFLLDSIGQSVFPDFVTIEQRPHRKGMLASAPFDNDGIATRDRTLVNQGVVDGYLLGVYSARQLKMQSTGNAGGLFHSTITTTVPDLDALLKMMDTGLLITEMMGSAINMANGDYSRGASGFWVEKGQIKMPVHEITVAGNLKDMYKNVVAIAGDIDEEHTLNTGSVLVEQMSIAGS
jgi:PmbA protein